MTCRRASAPDLAITTLAFARPVAANDNMKRATRSEWVEAGLGLIFTSLAQLVWTAFLLDQIQLS